MNCESPALRRFRGIVPPMITPLKDFDVLDVEGLERLVEHLLDGGVHGLFLLGSTGEGPGLSYRLRRELVARVCKQVGGRVPVLVGISDTAFVESIAMAEAATESGADALVLTAPYYFSPGQGELIRYVEHVVEMISLPLMLYHMPRLTKTPFEIETLERLADIESIVGVKDGVGDLKYFTRLVGLREKRPDWSILMGPEHLLIESMRLGGDGGVHGGANVFPRLFTDCYDAIHAGDHDRANVLGRKIIALGETYRIGKDGARSFKAMKCVLCLMGVCDDFMAEPFSRFAPEDRDRIRSMLEPTFGDLQSPTF